MRTLWVLLLLTMSACATSPASSPRNSARELDAITWLNGSWRTTSSDTVVEETWAPAWEGVMMGLSRSASADGRVSVELMRIQRRGSQLVYIAAPATQAVTTFEASETSRTALVVENPDHDFPQRIAYTRRGDDQLRAEISGRADQPRIAWDFERSAAADAFPIKQQTGQIRFDPSARSVDVEVGGSFCAQLVCAVVPAPGGAAVQVAVLDTSLDCSEPARGQCIAPQDVSQVMVGAQLVDLRQATATRPWSGPIPFLYRLD